MTRLTDLPPGERAALLSIGGERSFKRRLMELGLLPGTQVRLVRRVNIGDLLEVEVRGSHLSLRRGDASQLTVGPIV